MFMLKSKHTAETENLRDEVSRLRGARMMDAKTIRGLEGDIAAARDEVEALVGAGSDAISQASDHYTARNNRRMTIQGDDGEKCWIVPFDAFEQLRYAIDRARDAAAKRVKRGVGK